MSSLALKNKITFAPKRGVWYGDFFAPKKARPYVVIVGVLSPVLFATAFIFTLAMATAVSASLPLRAPAAVALAVPALPQSSPLVASVDATTRYLHVPGAYVDTSTVVPAIEAPQAVITKEDVADVWNKTFGLEGNVFVASVYEFGHQGKQTLVSEVNIGEAWHAYIDGLSTLEAQYLQN